MKTGLHNIVSALTGGDGGDGSDEEGPHEDEEESEGFERAAPERSDIVLDISAAAGLYSGADGGVGDDESDSEYGSTSTSDATGSGSASDRLPEVLRDEHYMLLERNGYWARDDGAERLAFALDVYARFRAYAPLGAQGGRDQQQPYNEVELVGLEYLVSDAGRHRYDALPFSEICLNGAQCASAFPLNKDCLDTFVVCRTHDHLYGRLIEDALLARADAWRLPQGLLEASAVYWRARQARFPLCRRPGCLAGRDHDRKACRHQWVVYTRLDSAFYRFCDAHRLQNPYVDYDRHDGASPTQLRISYHLVQFLCGPLLEPPPEAGVPRYDEWVMQPIEMIDLWNTASRVELNRNSTFRAGVADSDELRIKPEDLLL